MVCSCVKCNHKWFSRGLYNPKICPRCKTTKWSDVVIKENANLLYRVKCERCRYVWIPRIPNVKRCPRCGSVNWDEPKKF